MVPKGWQRKTVGELCDFVNGNGFKSAEWTDSGWPIIRIQNLNGSDKFNFYNGEINDKWVVNPGDILFAWAGTKGVSFGAKRWEGPVGLLNQHIFRVTPKIKVNPTWLYLAMLKVTERVESMAHGFKSTLLHVQKSDITDQVLNVPPVEEQKKIAEILSTWEEAITTTEKLLANSQQQKKALMEQLLTGKKRFLDKNGVRFSGEWIHGRLGDLCVFKGGSAFKEVYQGQSIGELPFIKVSDMNLPGNERSIEYSNNWVSFETAKLMKAKPFPKSSIIFAKVGAALLLNRRRILSRPTIIDNNMMAAVPSNAADTEFLYQLLLAIDFARFVQEGAVPSINQGDLSSFKISYPDVEEQQKIATVLSNSDQQISALQQKLDALKQEKKALMQQLLTGKRRVLVNK